MKILTILFFIGQSAIAQTIYLPNIKSTLSGTQYMGHNAADVNVVNPITVSVTSVDQGNKGTIPESWYVQPCDGTNCQSFLSTGEGKVAITKALPANTAGNSPGSSTVSTVATLTAPANSVGFILMNLDTSTANIRWRIGATATTVSGQQLQPGRDTGYVPCDANISIVAESGTQNYDVQWVLSQ